MKAWIVALQGGPEDGRMMPMDGLGRRLIIPVLLPRVGLRWDIYEYTGLVPRLRVAFARYLGRSRNLP